MTPKAILILLFIELLIIYIIMSYKIYKLKEQHLKTLQQLIDKETPKKVKVYSFVNAKGRHIDEYYCGSCGQYIDRIKYENHCFNCGQALDWSDN
jgi:rubrerythrin